MASKTLDILQILRVIELQKMMFEMLIATRSYYT
jgi:hypothetical protein